MTSERSEDTGCSTCTNLFGSAQNILTLHSQARMISLTRVLQHNFL